MDTATNARPPGRARRSRRALALAATSAAALVAGMALIAAGPAPAPAPAAAPPDAALVERGRYIADAADCMPCHTAPGGQPYAGGRAIATPFGTVYSTNITPDAETGIGRWSGAEFARALHEGIRRDGADLYPAMPYTSYAGMTDADAAAVHAYLRSLPPVHAPPRPNELRFPFDVRAGLAVWRALFFRPETFRDDPARSPEWNRGAYLVQVLGHCGECHTPRNALGAPIAGRALTGAPVDGWFAPNISSDLRMGVGGWPRDSLVAWLRSGSDASKGTAFGPMDEVVHDSLAKLTDGDLHAIATYLQEGAAQPRAAALYADNCSGCHQADGTGTAGAVPPLAGNPAVQAESPDNAIQAMLRGIASSTGGADMPSFAGTLGDAQIADIANFIRTSWPGSSTGAAATPGHVAALRAADGLTPVASGHACPPLQPTGRGDEDALAANARDAVAGGTAAGLVGRAPLLLRMMERRHPGAGQPALVDALVAAYCPIVAADASRPAESRAVQAARFRSALEAAMTADPAPAARVELRTTLPPDALARAEAAARAAGLTLEAWLARAAEAAAPPAAPR